MFRKVFQNRPKKCCLICGDEAKGINFGCISCISCKAFFRRNALNNKELSCHFANSCQITKTTRRFCAKCRLKKCFEAGMKKDWILTDSEKRLMQQKIAQNRAARKLRILEQAKIIQESLQITEDSSNLEPQEISRLNSEQIYSLSTDSNSQISTIPESDEQNEILAELSLDDLLSNCTESCEFQSFLNSNLESFNLTQTLADLGDFGSFFNEIDAITSADSSASKRLNSKKDTSTHLLPLELSFFSDDLLEPEKAFLQELLSACSLLRNPYRKILTAADCEYSRWSRMPQFMLHRLIRMSKKLHCFNEIPVEFQAKVIKRRLVEMLSIRSATILYHQDRDSWSLIDDIGKANVMVAMEFIRPFCTESNYLRHQKFPSLFRDEWLDDNVILDLLTVIVLFSPSAEYEQNERIQSEHHRYTSLLNRYLHLKYPTPNEATECFNQMFSNLEEMRQLNGDIFAFFEATVICFKIFPFSPNFLI